jgi:GABA(A) receptor-associated protein
MDSSKLKNDVSSTKKTYMNGDFKKKYTLEQRKEESSRQLSKYKNRIPVIVEKANNNTLIKDIEKFKYLVPHELSVGQFIHVLRKRTKLAPEQAVLLFIGGSVPAAGALMSQIYKENKDVDGFLYATYSGESVFGNM